MALDTENPTINELRLENVRLRERLRVADATLEAIHRGEVDSLVARTPEGYRVFSLADAQTPYRLFIEEMQQGAATLGPKGTILYCNKSLLAMLGTPIERVIGAKWHTFVAAQDAATLGEVLAKANEGRAEADLSLRAADGTLIPVSITANPLSVEGVRPTCLVITDLTERRARELDLRKLSLALEQIAASVVITDTGGKIEYVNPRFCELTGCDAGVLVGLATRPEQPGQPLPILFEQIDKAVQSGLEWRGEFWDRERSGSLRRLLASISPLRTPDRQITHCVAIVEDATSTYHGHAIDQMFHAVHQRILDGETIETIVPFTCGQLAEIFKLPLVVVRIREQYGSAIVSFVGGPRSDALETVLLRDNGAPDSPSSSEVSGQILVFDLDDPRASPSAQTARGCGFRSVLIGPVSVRDELIGDLTLYSERLDLTCTEVVSRLGGAAERLGSLIGRARDQQRLLLQGTALASVANAVFITDRQGRIEWVNQSFSRLSGYRLDEVIGQTPRVLKSGQQENAAYVELWRTICAGGVWRGDICNRRQDGSLYTVTQTITPLRDSSGAISHFVAVHEDITQRRAAEARFEYIAHHDVLTGLANRAVLQRSLPEAMHRAKRNGTMLAVMFLDLDRFKLVNDSLGHSIGDALLKAVGDRLRSAVRAGDIVARLGGDEFAIVQTDLAQAAGSVILAKKLLSRIAEPIEVGNQEINTTASLGITLYPNDESDPEQLLSNADLAMYRAKNEGRNRYQFYSPKMNAEVHVRLQMERDLNHAVERHEFVLRYQPRIDQSTRRIIGVEALIRWQRPNRGMVGPEEFIPVAEECGLIVPLGKWMLDHACAQNHAWQSAGLPPICVSVNISPVQFLRDNIAESVIEALKQSGLDGRWLELEITEGLLMQSAEKAIAILSRLHELGVQFSIDDFGTGYSSLNYLRRFSVDKLKIDQSFVSDLETDDSGSAIVRAIISLGHSLGLKVVAEGVETKKQSDFLDLHGCDEYQGFLFHRPMPPAELAALLALANGATGLDAEEKRDEHALAVAGGPIEPCPREQAMAGLASTVSPDQ